MSNKIDSYIEIFVKYHIIYMIEENDGFRDILLLDNEIISTER
jgi:hypothetical protein